MLAALLSAGLLVALVLAAALSGLLPSRGRRIYRDYGKLWAEEPRLLAPPRPRRGRG